jgi:hypothetical protein
MVVGTALDRFVADNPHVLTQQFSVILNSELKALQSVNNIAILLPCILVLMSRYLGLPLLMAC